MKDHLPSNELDLLIRALSRSKAALPDLCRALGQGELFLLSDYHPELMGATVELQDGMRFPFIQVQSVQGPTVPAYTSLERANEGLVRCHALTRNYAIGAMAARQALEVIGKMNFTMTLNKGCSTGEVWLPANLLRDVADGSVFRPLPRKGHQNMNLTLIQPADYPTDLVHAAYELFRQHRNFRAAWIFTRDDQPAAYFLIVLMEPRDETQLHDLRLVVQSIGGREHPVLTEAVNEQSAEHIAAMFKCGPPFYLAPDYPPPPPAPANPS
jgi:hypothetical protein